MAKESHLVSHVRSSARHDPQLRRLIGASVSLVALAACALVVVQHSSSEVTNLASAQLAFGDAAFRPSAPAAVREGSVRGTVQPKFTPPGGNIDEYGLKGHRQKLEGHRQKLAQISAKVEALAFGDATMVKDADASSREGSVRNGKKPDFMKPLGDLGEVGLAKGAVKVLEPSAMQSKTQALAFGDATMVKDTDAAAREGSVRNGKKPDFMKPLGDLGEVGLAKGVVKGLKPSAMQSKTQALAFGDATMVKDTDAAAREGSVRNGVKPDFVTPLGDLGETGLAAAKSTGGKKLSDAAARMEMRGYYQEQAKAIKSHHAPELTSKAATAQLSGYFATLAARDTEEHAVTLEKAVAEAKAQRGTITSYYTNLQASDKKLHEAAVQRENAQDAAALAHLAAEAHKEPVAPEHAPLAAHQPPAEAVKKMAVQAPEEAAAPTEPKAAAAAAAAATAVASKTGDDANVVRAVSTSSAAVNNVKSVKKARAQQLAWASKPLGAQLSKMQFADSQSNRHGFHTHSMARNPQIKKEMAEARKIAAKDIDDALE